MAKVLSEQALTFTIEESKCEVISLESLRTYLKERRAALLQNKQNKNALNDHDHNQARTRVYSEQMDSGMLSGGAFQAKQHGYQKSKSCAYKNV